MGAGISNLRRRAWFKKYNPRMRHFLAVIVVALALAGTVAAERAPCPPSTVSRINILDVTVIDVANGAEQRHITVKIVGDRIAEVVPYKSDHRGECTQIVEGAGKFVIPGLWDMHVHTFFGTWVPGGREVTIPLFAANGITGVRDMGSELDLILLARSDIPPRVIISEYLDVAHAFFAGKEPAMVNGVLDKLARTLREGGLETESGGSPPR